MEGSQNGFNAGASRSQVHCRARRRRAPRARREHSSQGQPASHRSLWKRGTASGRISFPRPFPRRQGW